LGLLCYHYSDSIIVGFSHLHLSGTGIGDLADVLLMPINRKVDLTFKASHEINFINHLTSPSEKSSPVITKYFTGSSK
jgi:putative alpha-1,2-mannosidase